MSQVETILLSELADDLLTHLIESGMIEDPGEATVVAAAFFVGCHEKGWRFTKWVQPTDLERSIDIERQGELCECGHSRLHHGREDLPSPWCRHVGCDLPDGDSNCGEFRPVAVNSQSGEEQ